MLRRGNVELGLMGHTYSGSLVNNTEEVNIRHKKSYSAITARATRRCWGVSCALVPCGEWCGKVQMRGWATQPATLLLGGVPWETHSQLWLEYRRLLGSAVEINTCGKEVKTKGEGEWVSSLNGGLNHPSGKFWSEMPDLSISTGGKSSWNGVDIGVGGPLQPGQSPQGLIAESFPAAVLLAAWRINPSSLKQNLGSTSEHPLQHFLGGKSVFTF